MEINQSVCKIVACDHLCGSVAALLAERFVRDDFIIRPVVLLIANAHTESSQLATGLSTFEPILCLHSIEYDLISYGTPRLTNRFKD